MIAAMYTVARKPEDADRTCGPYKDKVEIYDLL
jgi:hypothetical protein